MGGRTGVEKGRKGREKGEDRRGEKAWGWEKEGRGMEGINLPHAPLKTLAALRTAIWLIL